MSQGDATVSRRIAGSASVLLLRRVVVMVLFAVSTAVTARLLGASDFGELATALGAFQIILAITDFGFSSVLSRELAKHPDRRASLFRAALQVQVLWASVLAVGALGLAAAYGFDSGRGQAMALLAPGIAVSGLASSRTIFLVLYRTRQLAVVDLSTSTLQVALIVAAAVAFRTPAAVALAYSVGQSVNASFVARAALRLVDRDRPTAAQRREIIRSALPLGTASVISTIYFSIDLVLLGSLIDDGAAIGRYAAAVKILSLLVTVPSIVLGSALPGFSSEVAANGRAGALAARVWHWLAVIGLPACVGVAVFAPTVVQIAFGSGFEGATPLLRILCLAAVIALFANVLGGLMVAHSMHRALLIQGVAALVVSVVGTVALVPLYGVAAAAWMTAATEAFLCGTSLWWLRGRLDLAGAARAVARPALAAGVLAATGLILAGIPALAIGASVLAFAAATAALGAWPEELRPRIGGTRAEPAR